MYSKTPIGFLQRVIAERIPRALRTADQAVTGGKVTQSLLRCFRYLVYQGNPVVLVRLSLDLPIRS